MEANFVLNSFRSIVAIIDKAIYNLIALIYQLLMEIVNTPIFSGDTISEFSRRIYAFIGVIMIFKVTFSLISYLVNPDSMSDKTNGAGNLAKNIVVTLFLIIIVPYAFDFLYTAQNAILEDNIISKLILGTENGELSGLKINMNAELCGKEAGVTTSNPGQYLALATLRPFYQPYAQIDKSTLGEEIRKYPLVNNSNVLNKYCTSNDVNELLTADIYKADEGSFDQNNMGHYLIDYSSILSTAVGVIVLLLLITTCMDIALRTIKLGFLELIAPVPIISYVDPKSGKDGMFKKWVNEVWKTWLSLFIRLATLYFAIYFIDLVNQSADKMDNGFWVTLFLIIGALMFVKQAPKLLENIFGLQFDALNLHPIKKFQEQAFAGKQIIGATGAVGTAALSGVGSAVAHGIARSRKKIEVGKKQAEYDKSDAKLQSIRNQMNLVNQKRHAALDGINGQKASINANRRTELDKINMERTRVNNDLANATNESDRNFAQMELAALNYQEERVNAKFDAQIGTVEAKEAKIKDNYRKEIERRAGQREIARLDRDDKEKSLEKEKNSRLYQKPVSGYAEEILRGMANGAKAGYKAPSKVGKNTMDSVQAASAMRNYREKYSIKDQIGDKLTDVLGIKNTSGTTSLNKEALKKLEDQLSEVTRQLDMSQNSLANLSSQMGANFERAIERVNGRMRFNESYSGPHRDDIKVILESYNRNVDSYNQIKKDIKELQDIQNASAPGRKGK